MSRVAHPAANGWPQRVCERRLVPLLALVFCLAFALRLGLAATVQGLAAEPSASAQPDQLDYEGLAFRVSAGMGYTMPSGAATYHRPPGTTLSLLPVYVLAGR